MGIRCSNYVDIMAIHPGVTGSCTLAVIKYNDGISLKGIVDFGLFQEKEYTELNKKLYFNPEELDFVLVTHNHVDHTGRLPLLYKNGYTGNIYTSYITKQLIPLALGDSYKVLRNIARNNNEQQLYSEDDVKTTLEKIVGCEYEKSIVISPALNDAPKVKVTFLSNGHLLGAAMIFMQIKRKGYGDINLLFTGDYNNKNMFFDVSPIPEWIKNTPLTVIQESTYGYMNSTDIKTCFENNIISAIKENKTILIPVFSLGRAQEIQYILKRIQDTGEISPSIPIYYDGKLSFKYTNIYLNGDTNIKPEMKDFQPENLQIVDDSTRLSIIEDENPKIILTTSGMGSYGPAQTYIPKLISRKNVLIHFTGYTSEGTLGSRLKNTPNGELVEVAGLTVIKRAEVEYTAEYSAHAKRDELLNFLKQFTNLNMVLINHGELSVKQSFARDIAREIDTRDAPGILGNGYFYRVGEYGLIKSLSTKFE